MPVSSDGKFHLFIIKSDRCVCGAEIMSAAGEKTAWQHAKPFVNGGLSGMMSTAIIQPIDMVKVRLQLGDAGGPVRC